MNLATWSIRNPIPAILLFVLLTLAGIWGFRALNIQDFPDLDLPTISVTLRLPGAAPAQLETEVAKKVEDQLATLQGLKHITTTITDSQVSMTVQFVLERPLADALIDVKDAVDRARDDLPTDLEQPQVKKVTVGPGGPVLTYAVTSSKLNEEALSWFTDDEIARRMLAVPGVGDFGRVGGVQREVQVRVDPARLNATGVTAVEVSRALKRVQQEASGGRGQLGGSEQGVRTIATVQRADELDALPIVLTDGRSIRLDQVAEVRDTIVERSQAALLDGKPAVGFQISRSKGFDETRIAAGVAAAIESLLRDHPDLDFELIASSVEHTEEQYRASIEMLYEGAILAVLVIWLFLRDWRATFIGAVALPLSILPAFAFMALADFSLNTITLLALAVLVGLLVDDAIVEVENIARHANMGKTVRQATEDAVNEIALAVIATTATLVVVFLPTAFMSGIPGLVFKQFGWTVVIAVLTSLMVARLITPMMAAWLIRPSHRKTSDGPLMRWYLGAVRWCLKHRVRTVIAGGTFFIFSLALVPLLPKGFVAASDRGRTTIEVELPPGATLQRTIMTAEEARNVVATVEGVRSVFVTAGTAQRVRGPQGSSAGEVRKATLTVLLGERGDRPSQQDIENRIRPLLAQVPGARFSMGGGGPGEKLQLILSGQDAALLKRSAQRIEEGLRRLPYLSGINSTASLERPEITVRPDPARAAERGVSTAAIGETLRVATSGDFDAALAKLNLDNRQIDIRVMVPEAVRQDAQAIAALRVPGRAGLVPLDSVASITVESGPSQIQRYDRSRNVTITADLGGFPLGTALRDSMALPEVTGLPAGVRLIQSGDAEIMGELFGGFGMALLTGVLCMYCVLVLLFRDWFQPLTILSAVPLCVGGAFIALLATGSELGISPLIGLVMLLGIVTKNSILLVEYAIMEIEQRGLSEFDALVEACHKRARPILMTTVAMAAGMTPLALGLSGDASFRQPMAIAVIGGLITSTALSLLLVPVVFTYVSRLERRARRWVGIRDSAQPEAA